MPVIKHEHQLTRRERAFFEAVCADPDAATDARNAIRREYAQYFDMSVIPEKQQAAAPFNTARRFRRLFERRGVEVSWAGGAKKAAPMASSPGEIQRRSTASPAADAHPPSSRSRVDPVASPREPLYPDIPAPTVRYTTFSPTVYDAALEEIRAMAMEAGTLSVALQAVKLRAAYHGLLDRNPSRAEEEDDKEKNPFEGMSHAEAERIVEGLLGEYRATTGRTLSPRDGSDDDEEVA